MTATATLPPPTAAPTQPTQEPQQQPPQPSPLWPIPLEVVGVTGEYQSGKTAWLLDICTDPTATLYYDFEKSGRSYTDQMGIARVDFPKLAQQHFPKGYRPVDLFVLWRDHVLAQPVNRWKVIAVDPINDLQDGLVWWVKDNAAYFGKTVAQYMKMSQLMWADAKVYLKQLMNEIATRAETFAFSTHMRDVYKGQQATGRREAKGLETFYEMSSAYFQLERRPDAGGVMPGAPSGTVLKDRLAKIVVDPVTHKRQWLPVLPKRMPVCTPDSLREYMTHPAGSRQLTPGELAVEVRMSDDEKLMVQAQMAQDQRDTEAYRLELAQKREPQQRASQQAAAQQATAAPAAAAAATAPSAPIVPVTPAQLELLKYYNSHVGTDTWKRMLKRIGVTSATKLSREQADELIGEWSRQNGAVGAAYCRAMNAIQAKPVNLPHANQPPAPPTPATAPAAQTVPVEVGAMTLQQALAAYTSEPVNDFQIARLKECRTRYTAEQWRELLNAYNAPSALKLTNDQALDLLAKIEPKPTKTVNGKGSGTDVAGIPAPVKS